MVYGVAIFAILVAGYPLLMRLLARAVAARRERMAVIAAVIAQDDTFPSELRPMVAWMLETAFSARLMLIMTFTMPIFAIEALRGHNSTSPEIKVEDSHKEFHELIGCHLSSIAAANPLFALVASLEMALIGFVLYPLGRMSSLTRISFGALMTAERHDQAHA